MAGNRTPMFPVSILLLVLAVYLSTAVSKRSLSTKSNQCALKLSRCKAYSKHINVKIVARNVLVEPNFEEQVTISNEPQYPLIHFLEQAAELNGAFNFSASYHPSLGYLVNTINHVTANVTAQTYWNIKSVTNGYNSLLCGVSTYIPNSAEEILFNFTTWG